VCPCVRACPSNRNGRGSSSLSRQFSKLLPLEPAVPTAAQQDLLDRLAKVKEFSSKFDLS
jgi:hypothetical protein